MQYFNTRNPLYSPAERQAFYFFSLLISVFYFIFVIRTAGELNTWVDCISQNIDCKALLFIGSAFFVFVINDLALFKRRCFLLSDFNFSKPLLYCLSAFPIAAVRGPQLRYRASCGYNNFTYFLTNQLIL